MQQNQVIEFKQVNNTRALNTNEELKRSLLANNLDKKLHSISERKLQCYDSCSSALRFWRHAIFTRGRSSRKKNRVSQALRMRTENSGRASIASNRRKKFFKGTSHDWQPEKQTENSFDYIWTRYQYGTRVVVKHNPFNSLTRKKSGV